MYNQQRANVRNYLVGLNIPEVLDFMVSAHGRGDNDAVDYAGEFVCELYAELE